MTSPLDRCFSLLEALNHERRLADILRDRRAVRAYRKTIVRAGVESMFHWQVKIRKISNTKNL